MLYWNRAECLIKSGHTVTYVTPDKSGIIDVQKITNAITEKTQLVSVMLANNEIGTIQPIEQICKNAAKKEYCCTLMQYRP